MSASVCMQETVACMLVSWWMLTTSLFKDWTNGIVLNQFLKQTVIYCVCQHLPGPVATCTTLQAGLSATGAMHQGKQVHKFSSVSSYGFLWRIYTWCIHVKIQMKALQIRTCTWWIFGYNSNKSDSISCNGSSRPDQSWGAVFLPNMDPDFHFYQTFKPWW